MRVTAIQIAAIARPVHAATQLRFSAGDATGRSARSDVGDRNGPLIAIGVPKAAGCVTQELMSLWIDQASRRRSGTPRGPNVILDWSHSTVPTIYGQTFSPPCANDAEFMGRSATRVAGLEAVARNAATRYFHRKWTNTRPELCGSFSTRW